VEPRVPGLKDADRHPTPTRPAFEDRHQLSNWQTVAPGCRRVPAPLPEPAADAAVTTAGTQMGCRGRLAGTEEIGVQVEGPRGDLRRSHRPDAWRGQRLTIDPLQPAGAGRGCGEVRPGLQLTDDPHPLGGTKGTRRALQLAGLLCLCLGDLGRNVGSCDRLPERLLLGAERALQRFGLALHRIRGHLREGFPMCLESLCDHPLWAQGRVTQTERLGGPQGSCNLGSVHTPSLSEKARKVKCGNRHADGSAGEEGDLLGAGRPEPVEQSAAAPLELLGADVQQPDCASGDVECGQPPL
jgi:hypothetical protein